METASFVLGGVILGWGAKTLFGGDDTWIVIGAVAGIASGISQLIRGGLKLNRELDRAAGIGPRTSKADSKGSEAP